MLIIKILIRAPVRPGDLCRQRPLFVPAGTYRSPQGIGLCRQITCIIIVIFPDGPGGINSTGQKIVFIPFIAPVLSGFIGIFFHQIAVIPLMPVSQPSAVSHGGHTLRHVIVNPSIFTTGGVILHHPPAITEWLPPIAIICAARHPVSAHQRFGCIIKLAQTHPVRIRYAT